jgi:hydrogenase maturation protein HypF
VSTALSARRRVGIRVEGIVQGVGFRPYVFRLAGELGLAGYVLNDEHGVLLEIEGRGGQVDEFLRRLALEAPPLAVLERVVCEDREPSGAAGFEIRHSERAGAADVPVSPDTATCAECLRELFDRADRRFRYPFINCTNCGPRFTIVRAVPYDRPLTTMAAFRMCARCRTEYEDPRDRRFHAQPNACPDCGPSLSLLDRVGQPIAPGNARDAVRAAADMLLRGRIVAVKGIGGFHLACRAGDHVAVAELRARKHREDKPFALMVPDLDAARRLVHAGEAELRLLTAPARPIVLAPRRPDAPVAAAVAPGAPELGVMLPYSPLHHLLLADVQSTLVMTSGNVSDEPIAYHDEDGLDRLSGIADAFLVHDRPIETRTDDSVVRTRRGRTTFLRRSRGWVPASIALPGAGAPVPLLACGAELKNTFCVAKGTRAWVSHHIGDLANFETLRSFTTGIEHFERLFDAMPEAIAYDLHPEYLSTKYALEREGVALLGVQHHHAHLAACLAEHGETDPARPSVGAIFDGTGYGLDGTVWGGELLLGGIEEVRRVGWLMPAPLPGGERAIREPWRMACAWLLAAGCAEAEPPVGLRGRIDPARWRQVRALAESDTACPRTSSIGRLFDAVSALCGVRAEINYEGQAAIELEAACDPLERGFYPISLDAEGDAVVIDPRETILAAAADIDRGTPVGVVASRFHRGLGRAAAAACVLVASRRGAEVAVLSGGVFANRRLLDHTATEAAAAGLRVLTPERLPSGDGGISYGQAAVAAALLGGRKGLPGDRGGGSRPPSSPAVGRPSPNHRSPV